MVTLLLFVFAALGQDAPPSAAETTTVTAESPSHVDVEGDANISIDSWSSPAAVFGGLVALCGAFGTLFVTIGPVLRRSMRAPFEEQNALLHQLNTRSKRSRRDMKLLRNTVHRHGVAVAALLQNAQINGSVLAGLTDEPTPVFDDDNDDDDTEPGVPPKAA